VQCTLVDNLPDILTENDEDVDLPPQLVEKWKTEGRYEEEMKELDAFFDRTGHPRAPRFYIMKWLSDYITDFGIDGYRVDTVRHTEEYVWEEFREVCDDSFASWKQMNPEKVLDDNDFYLVGEIYGYRVQEGQYSDFGDRKVRYFGKSFNALINFDLRSSADRSYEAVFSEYSKLLHSELAGFGTMSYLTSHDDGSPFDKERTKTYETAIRLLLAPGAAQIYYGDEVGRTLIIEGTVGDATLRSPMDWDAINNNPEKQQLKSHWEKLGQFRKAHPAVGAGKHKMITKSPYVFKRVLSEGDFGDAVVVALDLNAETQTIDVGNVFKEGESVREAYSGQLLKVKDGKVSLKTKSGIALLESIKK
ncbi:MAG: alpha-amylase, partial [Flavobacteriaceae bacterium]|nr:alpha-amylase [Flavobacteriaceae bacterium]